VKSLVVPLTYIVILVGSLIIFSRIYRRRTAKRIAQQEPWFPSHPERDVYISLLQQQSPPASDVILKAALLRRAVTDVQRIIQFREDKAALQNLLQKGSIGDDLWNAFQAAEKELEAEIVEVVAEANTFREGWGQFIFASASETANNLKHRDLFFSIPKLRADAEAKYGSAKTKSVKAITSTLTVPSPQPSAPASPKTKPTTPPIASPSKPSSTVATSMHKTSSNGSTASPSSPAPYIANGVNGEAGPSTSALSSPSTTPASLPKTGKPKAKKRKN